MMPPRDGYEFPPPESSPLDDFGDRPTPVYAPPPGAKSLRPAPLPRDVAPYTFDTAPRGWSRQARAVLAAAIIFPWSLVALGVAAAVQSCAAIEAATIERPVTRVYVPRCAPAFAGRALVCIDGPRAVTVRLAR